MPMIYIYQEEIKIVTARKALAVCDGNSWILVVLSKDIRGDWMILRQGLPFIHYLEYDKGVNW